MYSLLYSLYYSLRRVQKAYRDDNGIRYRFSTFLIGYIETYYNLNVVKQFRNKPSHESGVTEVKREQKIIVSLTSFPARINVVWIAIETLLRQSMKPDEIILWLAEEQFPNKDDDLPKELLQQKERGLTIRYCDDLRSHKKYFYTMQEYPEDLIILTDDDAFYSKDLVEKLYKLHQENPEDIVCMTTAIIYPDIHTAPTYWTRPLRGERIIHSETAQPFTGQGTLYPPHSIPDEAFNAELIKELCLHADDLWLKYMSMRNGVKTTVMYKERSMPVGIYGTPESSLWHINGEERQNDIQWENILRYFGELNDSIQK